MRANLASFGLVLLVGCLLAVCLGCPKMNIPGNVAGMVIGEGGVGQGFVSVQLIDVTTNQTVMVENANESGSYMFKDVMPGKYIMKTSGIGGADYPNDCKEFTLTPGKTVSIDIKLLSPAEQQPE